MAATLTIRCRWHGALLAMALVCVANGALAADQQQTTAPGPRWGHEVAQVAPDPAVRFGRLPNGLRYALQHNETPADGVAMRLRIGAGSLLERDGEEGVAHLLEHMAFRGSAGVTDGEVVRLLQRQGLAYGPDTNASTDFNQTLYRFNFPRADAAALDTGLMLFREIADRLTLDPQLLETEKGVVLAEARLRDVPAFRVELAEINNVWAGTLVARRWSIGRAESVRAATAQTLRRYYRAHYRPDNATVVVVGRIDVDAVERQIRERFGDWRNDGPAESPDIGSVQGVQPAVEFIGKGVGEALSLTWLPPAQSALPGPAADRERLVRQVASNLFHAKLWERVWQPGCPYEFPSLRWDGDRARVAVVPRPGQWRAALEAVVEVLRRLTAPGAPATNLPYYLQATRDRLKAAAEPTASRSSVAIADALVAAAASPLAYRSAAQELASDEPVLASLQAPEVMAALRSRFAGTPVVFRSAPSEPAGVDALARQLAVALSRPLAEPVPPQAASAEDAIDLGAPSDVVARVVDAELGTTRVEFANGTRLLVKPTTHEKGRVSVQARLGQGLSGIPGERCHARWALGLASQARIGKRRSPVHFGALDAANQAVVLRSDWDSGILQGLLKDMASFVRDPVFPAELGDRLAFEAAARAQRFDAEPGTAFQRELDRVAHANDPCLASAPSLADLRATQLADLPALLGPAFATAADVVLVGDVGVEEAIKATQASFGAGPARPRLPRLPLRLAPRAAGATPPVVITHGGRADQGMLGLLWPTPDYWADPSLEATGAVAATLLKSRLTEGVREALGLTYSPSVRSFASAEVQGQGFFVVELELAPENFARVRHALQAEVQALAGTPPTADELQRSRQPLIEAIQHGRRQNAFWAAVLPLVLADDRIKAEVLQAPARLQAVDAKRIQAYFRDHIARRPPIEVQAVAASPQSASTVPTPSAP